MSSFTFSFEECWVRSANTTSVPCCPPPPQVNLHENVVDDLANNAPVMDRGLRQLADGPLEIGKIFLTTLGSWAQQLEYRPFNQAMSLNPAWRLAYFFLIGITYFIVQGL